jgi:hypothetical protein
VWEGLQEAMGRRAESNTTEGAASVALVSRHLREGHLYDLVFIVEMFAQSCALFDAAMPLLGTSWSAAMTRFRDSHGSEEYKARERAEIAAARQDPYVLRVLANDIALYEEAMRMAQAQQREWGVA